jgi:curved DNA-binding protein CbpA
MLEDYYEILEVHPKASQEVIRKAYMVLAKRYHPDVCSDKELANKMMARINAAYHVLSDSQRRAEYDLSFFHSSIPNDYGFTSDNGDKESATPKDDNEDFEEEYDDTSDYSDSGFYNAYNTQEDSSRAETDSNSYQQTYDNTGNDNADAGQDSTESSTSGTQTNANDYQRPADNNYSSNTDDDGPNVERNKKILGFVAAIFAVIVLFFAFSGPSERQVEKLYSEGNSRGLYEIISQVSRKDQYTDITYRAAIDIIKLNDDTSINYLSNLLIRDEVNIKQKESIIKAFNDSHKLIPSFYYVFDKICKKQELRELMITNGTTINPNIFKEKVVADIDTILKDARSNAVVNYVEAIAKAMQFNVKVTKPVVYDDLKFLTDIYGIQSYVKNKDYDGIYRILDGYTMHKDSNLQQESANTRKHILELFNDEKEAEKKKAKLNDDYNKLNTESQVSMEKMEMGPALKEANATIRIDYECIKYFDDGSLLISLESGRLAIISNPMDSFDSGWYYSYVVQDGTTGITRNDDGVHLTIPEYRMVDVEGNNRIIYQHLEVYWGNGRWHSLL